MHNASQQVLLTSACVPMRGRVPHVKKPQELFKLRSQAMESQKMPDLQVLPCNPACAPEGTGELMLSCERMLMFESIWLADTSQLSRMPHCKTNSFCEFGGLPPTFEWNSQRFWLFPAFVIFGEVKMCCHTGLHHLCLHASLGRMESDPLLLERKEDTFCDSWQQWRLLFPQKLLPFLKPTVAKQPGPVKPGLFPYS